MPAKPLRAGGIIRDRLGNTLRVIFAEGPDPQPRGTKHKNRKRKKSR